MHLSIIITEKVQGKTNTVISILPSPQLITTALQCGWFLVCYSNSFAKNKFRLQIR